MQDTRWDHGLKVTGEGKRLVGHAGAVLLRKLADQAGLTASLGSALARKGKFPLVDRGVALVSWRWRSLWGPPAWPTSRTWPWKDAFLACWQRL